MEKVISFCFVIALVFLNFVECKNLDPAAEEFLKIVNAENIKATDSKDECIKKHYECTNDRNNCCYGRFLQLSCHCYEYHDEEENMSSRCKCMKPPYQKALEFGFNMWNFFVGK
ncbi:U1-lycotoxin-Ls1b-like isoform X2 [Parasteatoda tepidariorum]|uniref:U1-lycotoxin-Ls1b-like isoform X2 n=1 Tax=Parasteatoda tepidariorum TaxID=114398 RepID=UPI001C71A2C6|nr:toxin CSTX-11-like isoform X2 [Parasteatoda tepidariorum]